MIPDFQTLMLPILEILKDGKEYHKKDIVEAISIRFNLTEDERNKILPKSSQKIIDNRVAWALSHFKKANVVKSFRRGYYLIQKNGLIALEQKPKKIDLKFLRKFPEFNAWVKTFKSNSKSFEEEKKLEINHIENSMPEQTPEELIEFSYQKIREELVLELIDKIKTCSSRFFEQLVIDLLIAMGYGGSRIDAGQVVGKSGDGGIDGIIKEDKLGLDNIYIQAKRWEGQVTISTVRDFAGSLLAKKAKKGIFITTSTFPKSAYEFISNIEPRIILIDGKELAEMMIDYNVGVSIKTNYEIKKIDNDYFEDE